MTHQEVQRRLGLIEFVGVKFCRNQKYNDYVRIVELTYCNVLREYAWVGKGTLLKIIGAEHHVPNAKDLKIIDQLLDQLRKLKRKTKKSVEKQKIEELKKTIIDNATKFCQDYWVKASLPQILHEVADELTVASVLTE